MTAPGKRRDEGRPEDQGALVPASVPAGAAPVAVRRWFDELAAAERRANDGSLAAESNPNICTPNRAKGSWAARATLYGQLGWIEDVQSQVRKAQFARDPVSRNRLNATIPYQRIGNLMVTATALIFEA